jgi:hypothetical protein
VGRSIGEILAVPTLGVNPLNGRRLAQKKDGTIVQYDHLGTGWTTLEGKTVTAPSQLADGVFMAQFCQNGTVAWIITLLTKHLT